MSGRRSTYRPVRISGTTSHLDAQNGAARFGKPGPLARVMEPIGRQGLGAMKRLQSRAIAAFARFLAGEAVANNRAPFERDTRAPFAFFRIDEFDARGLKRPPNRLNGCDFYGHDRTVEPLEPFYGSTETRACAATVDCSQRRSARAALTARNRAFLPLALALSDPAREIDALYEDMLANTHCDGKPHPVVAAAARDMLNRPDEERGSVLSTAISSLSLYRDP